MKDNSKRNFENRFQKWSNKQSQDETSSYGFCGTSIICDYCTDVSYGRPCVRALNSMLAERNRIIDYSRIDFENIWNGEV